MKPDLINTIEKAFEKGLYGKISNFESWLQEKNINPLKLNNTLIENYLNTNIYIDKINDDILGLIEFIGYYLRNKKNLYYQPILGVWGSGKTYNALYLEKVLESISKKYKLNYVFCAGSKFEDDDYYEEICDLISEETDIMIIDECEVYPYIFNMTIKFSELMKTGLIIGTWTPERFMIYEEDLSETFIVLKDINLSPLTIDEIKIVSSQINDYLKIDEKVEASIVNLQVFNVLNKFARGIPRLIIKLLVKVLNETYRKGKISIDNEIIDIVAMKLGLNHEMDFKDLSETQIKILKFVLNTEDKRGLRPSFLIRELELSKATVSYHLKILREKKKMLKSKKIGRRVFYNIKEEIKPFIQKHIEIRSVYNEY